MMPVCHRWSSSPKNFAYETLASLEEDGLTFLAVYLHCNPVLAKERSSLNSCKLVYLLWLWYPLTSNWRCSRSHPHLRRMAFVAGIKKWRWYASSFTACDITICFASAFAFPTMQMWDTTPNKLEVPDYDRGYERMEMQQMSDHMMSPQWFREQTETLKHACTYFDWRIRSSSRPSFS